MLRFLRDAPASWLSDVQNAIVMITIYLRTVRARSRVAVHGRRSMIKIIPNSTTPSTPRVRGVDLCIIIVHHSPLRYRYVHHSPLRYRYVHH
jgi:hypothetical protein